MRKHVLFTVLKAYLLVGFLTGCSFTDQVEVQSLYGYSMGTSYHIKLVTPLSKAQRLQLGIEGLLADVNARMSTYLASSDLSKFKDSSINEPVTVSERTVSVIQRSLEIAVMTDGYFDPTIAPLVDLWGFGPSAKISEQPSLDQIQQLLPLVDYQHVIVDAANNTLSKSAQSELDLSAIAKGYAVDLVADYLISKGVSNFLVEIGGEMRSSGVKPTGESWRIAIEAPYVNEQRVYEILELKDMAIATSGDYRNYFESEGKRYSHTINPKTGSPVIHNLASASVIMNDCMDADAFATAFMAMGVDKALKLANEQRIAAYFIYRDGEQFNAVASEEFVSQFGEQLASLRLELGEV